MTSAITSRQPTHNATSTTRILLVDDHPIVRKGLRLMIEQVPGFDVCGEASGMAEAMKQCRDTRPEVVVADITLEDGSGLELVKELVAHDRQVKVLVCSMHDEALFAERAMHAGAKGYINKDEAPERLIDAIRRVAEGRAYLSEQMTDRMLTRQIGSGDGSPTSAIETLSDRELEVFEQIGHGITTRQIAQKLHLSPKTIETYRENIKHKLHLANATELTQHAVQWVLEAK